jgi:kynurenine formamidase
VDVTVEPTVPNYATLKENSSGPAGSAWGLFGFDDELGTINLLTADRVRGAARCVRSGKTFSLDWPVNAFDPQTSASRRPAVHTIFSKHPNGRDDYLDSFYLQGSSQLDGLRHQRHAEYGFYNGRADELIRPGTETLGIQRWTDHGVVGRGVLLDVDAFARARGGALDHAAGEAFDAALLDQVADAQGVILEEGDILMIRTGWSRFYIDELDAAGRAALARDMHSSGLRQSVETIEWLWDHHFAAIVSDNVAVECVPAVSESPFEGSQRLMHQELIALLGMCIGELWRLDELAADCSSDGVYECMVVSVPLNLVGGVGSPSNAVAIK